MKDFIYNVNPNYFMVRTDRDRERQKEYYQEHRKQILTHVKERWDRVGNPAGKHPSYTHHRELTWAKYGILEPDGSGTLKWETYEAAIQKQNGKCAICPAELDMTKRRSIQVDHDHKTGKFRGLLCGKCNKMIGLADENVWVLRLAAEYLEA